MNGEMAGLPGNVHICARCVLAAMGHNDFKTTSLYVGLAREQVNKKMQKIAVFAKSDYL
jgi:hypothetical protein